MLESSLFHRLKALVPTKLQRRRAAFRLSMFFNSYFLHRLLIGAFNSAVFKESQPQVADALALQAAARLLAFESWCQDQGVSLDEFLQNSVHGMLKIQGASEAVTLEQLFNSLREVQPQPSEDRIREERQELEKIWQDMLEKEAYRIYWMC